MSAIINEKSNMNISIEESQEMVFRMLDLIGILSKGNKEKIEGIIIGVNLRENLEHSNQNLKNAQYITLIEEGNNKVGWTNKKSYSSYDTKYI